MKNVKSRILITVAVSFLLAAVSINCLRKVNVPNTNSMSAKDRVEMAMRLKDAKVELSENEVAFVETNKGKFKFKLYSAESPKTVRNFIRLADAGFYNGLTWHRYVSNFVIQGGDPLGNGTGNAGYNIDFEPNTMTHELGAVGMARGPSLNSGSCQFYICLAPQPTLDGNYVVFGIVTEGMDVVQKLRAGDTIKSITIKR